MPKEVGGYTVICLPARLLEHPNGIQAKWLELRIELVVDPIPATESGLPVKGDTAERRPAGTLDRCAPLAAERRRGGIEKVPGD